MKKILLWLLVLTMCISMVASFSLVGCKERPAPAEEEAVEEAAEEVAEEVATVEEEVDTELAPYLEANIDWRQFEGETINVAVVHYLDTEEIGNQVSLFEELTGITVNYGLLPEEELHQKAFVDLASRTGQYDIISADFMFIPQFTVEPVMIEPLDDFKNDPSLTDPEWFDYDDLMPHLMDAVNVDGKDYGIPLNTDTSLLFYRKDLLEAADVSVPDTLEDFWNAAEALNNPPEVYGLGLRGLRGQGENIYVWTGFFRAMGAKFFEDFPNDMTPTVNSPEGIEGTQYYADIIQNFAPLGSSNWTWSEVLSGLQQGTIAMSVDASDFGPSIEDPEKSTTAGKWGYALVPGGDGGRWQPFFCFVLSINSASKNKGPAWLFLQFVGSKPASNERSLKTWTTMRWSVWERPEMQEVMAQYVGYYDALDEALQYVDADYRPRFPKWREMGDQLGIAVESVIAGEKTAEEAMNEVQAEIEKILE